MDKTVVILAGGPSLTKKDVAYVEKSGVDIIGINDAYRICNKLKILYACDRRWWFHHYSTIADMPFRKISLEDAGYPRIETMENDGLDGLSLEWPKLRTGGNSGYQAINLAILLGYKKIVLLGYDMKHSGDKVHWFGDHPSPLSNAPAPRLKDWSNRFNKMAALIPEDVEVINCSRETAIDCFPRKLLENVLNA